MDICRRWLICSYGAFTVKESWFHVLLVFQTLKSQLLVFVWSLGSNKTFSCQMLLLCDWMEAEFKWPSYHARRTSPSSKCIAPYCTFFSTTSTQNRHIKTPQSKHRIDHSSGLWFSFWSSRPKIAVLHRQQRPALIPNPEEFHML